MGEYNHNTQKRHLDLIFSLLMWLALCIINSLIMLFSYIRVRDILLLYDAVNDGVKFGC